MRLMAPSLCLAAALSLGAQSADPPELVRARQEADRVRKLVEEGVLPRNALQEAEAAVSATQDLVVLEKLLYGEIPIEELTEAQAEEMVAAARRQWQLRQHKLEQAKHLVNEGVASRTSLTPLVEDLDRSRKTFDLADSRARLLRELAAMVRAEEALESSLLEEPEEAPKIAERFDGDGVFLTAHLKTIVLAFERQFQKKLPISARGETALHRALRFDHRGRVDVALSPDSVEGAWLREFLQNMRVPYFAFRAYVPGKSTAPHIHIGPPSGRLPGSD